MSRSGTPDPVALLSDVRYVAELPAELRRAIDALERRVAKLERRLDAREDYEREQREHA